MFNIPPVTKNIIIINLLMFFGKLVAIRYGIDFDDLLGLHFFKASDFRLYQFFTYMFVHAGWEHIFFNMFAVWMFGRVMEQVMGSSIISSADSEPDLCRKVHNGLNLHIKDSPATTP